MSLTTKVLLQNERSSVINGMHNGSVIRHTHNRPIARLVESSRRELQNVTWLDFIKRDAVSEGVTSRWLSSGGSKCLVSEVPAFTSTDSVSNVIRGEVNDLTLEF